MQIDFLEMGQPIYFFVFLRCGLEQAGEGDRKRVRC